MLCQKTIRNSFSYEQQRQEQESTFIKHCFYQSKRASWRKEEKTEKIHLRCPTVLYRSKWTFLKTLIMAKSRSYCKFPIRTRFGTEAELHQKRLFFDGPKNWPRRGPAESKLVVIRRPLPVASLSVRVRCLPNSCRSPYWGSVAFPKPQAENAPSAHARPSAAVCLTFIKVITTLTF